MSLAAGFDFVHEVSNATLTKLIKSSVSIDGTLLNPPFELSLRFTGGRVHLVVNDVQLDLEGDDSITLSLAFSDSAVVLPPKETSGVLATIPGTSRARGIAPLDGTIKINILLSLVRGLGNRREVSGDTSTADVRILYSSGAEQVITSALSGTGVSADQFKDLAINAFTQLARNVPRIATPFGFDVVPGTDGFIDQPENQQPLTLSSLQMRCIGHSDRNRQSLSLLGNFFVATQANGDRTNKTETAILPGEDFATFFSRRACHSLIFCPSFAESLSTHRVGPQLKVPDLPLSCGTAGSLSLDRIELRALVDTYAQGVIHINGDVAKSGPCYEATGSFSAQVTLAVGADRRSFATKITLDEPDIDVSVDWYCSLASVGLFGYFSLYIVSTIEELMNQVTRRIARSSLRGSLLGLGPTGQQVPQDSTLSSVSVAPDGLTLQGRTEIYVPYVSSAKSLSIRDLGTTEQLTGAAELQWETKVSCQPQQKSYSYLHTQQHQIRTFDLESQFVTPPLSVTYALRGSSRGVGGLPGSSGPSIKLKVGAFASHTVVSHTVVVPNVECTYPFPLGTAGSTVTQDVHLTFLIDGTSIKLENAQPGEGNFYVLLEASVLDGTGSAPSGVDSTPDMWVLFEGFRVVMGEDYMKDYLECEVKSVADIPLNYMPTWDFEVDPSPAWQTIALIRGLNEMESRGELVSGEVEQLLLHSQLTRSAGFSRAYHTMFTTQSGKMKEPSQALKLVEVELRSRIATLTDRLAQVERAAELGVRRVRRLNIG